MNPWPHAGKEILLGDQRTVGLDQDQENIECPRTQLYGHAIGDQ
jgi:hypothetical protein